MKIRSAGMFILLILLMTVSIAAQAQSGMVWRLQIRLVTSGISNADTDDRVSVSLSPNNRTYIDYARDDLERRDDFTYDLLLTNINTISDITRLEIHKEGTDGWCLHEVELFVNSASTFRQVLDCRWLDGDDGHRPTLTFNRRDFNFLNAQLLLPGRTLSFSGSGVNSLIESAVGHNIASNSYYWRGGRSVSISKVDDTTIRVGLPLKVEIDNATDPNVTINYDVRFSCDNDGRILATVSRIRIDRGRFIGVGVGIIYDNNPALIDFSAQRLRNSLARMANCRNLLVVGDGILLY